MSARINTADSTVLLTALMEGGCTYDDLAAKSGLSKRRVARWVKNNRDLLVIADWAADKNGRLFVPVFRYGPKAVDKPRPGRVLTPAQQMAKLRARRKNARQGQEDRNERG